MPANISIQKIQNSLVAHGAVGILMEYERGTGRIEAIKFQLEIQGNKIPFRLPTDWRKFQAVLKEQEVRRWDDEDFCYRVAWANIRDLVLAQMAFCETQMAETPQLLLGYAMDVNGVSTLYDRVIKGQFLLGDGK